jgi:hypothetical protein
MTQSDNTTDPGAKRDPNDFLAPMANESTALLILTYLVIVYIAILIFKKN